MPEDTPANRERAKQLVDMGPIKLARYAMELEDAADAAVYNWRTSVDVWGAMQRLNALIEPARLLKEEHRALGGLHTMTVRYR